ncbi:MAG: hypothetical protein GC182_15905 [Rhodopseudomonas sp.]|nr:hypothetical protein [Rhodopseudomonas sp.]
MSARRIEIAPELIAEGRRLYERTQTPLRDVAAVMGISRRTLENRIREFNWRRRRVASRPIELLHVARGAAIAAMTGDDTPATDDRPVSSQRRAAIAERIQAVVEREMEAVERVLAVIGPADQAEAEGSARALASIARTLREVAALNLPNEEVKDADDADAGAEIPRDMDEFRRELARRLHAIIDAQSAEAGGGDRVADAGAVAG